MFSIIIHDTVNEKTLIYKDHLGIIPLYYGENKDGSIYISSELKTIKEYCDV